MKTNELKHWGISCIDKIHFPLIFQQLQKSSLPVDCLYHREEQVFHALYSQQKSFNSVAVPARNILKKINNGKCLANLSMFLIMESLKKTFFFFRNSNFYIFSAIISITCSALMTTREFSHTNGRGHKNVAANRITRSKV